ncbi:DUF1697 domain-containing protein, partial [Paracoccus sp. NGMCC 1.201697]
RSSNTSAPLNPVPNQRRRLGEGVSRDSQSPLQEENHHNGDFLPGTHDRGSVRCELCDARWRPIPFCCHRVGLPGPYLATFHSFAASLNVLGPPLRGIMALYIALLRAVNVGGTGKLPMSELRKTCEEIGFEDVRTYIQSGNVVFRTRMARDAAATALKNGLAARYGKPVGVILREAEELRQLIQENPFPTAAPNRVLVLFVEHDAPLDRDDIGKGRKDEEVAFGRHEVIIHYPSGMGTSRLRLAAMAIGTARNLNTVAKLAEMAHDKT